MATSTPTNAQPNGSTPDAKPPAAIVTRAADQGGALNAFASVGNFIDSQRMATALSQSTMVPTAYRGNIPNCMIALELASRLGASVFSVMQNLDVIHGTPSFRAKFLIGTVNASKRFTPMRFKWFGKPNTMEWGCRAVATDIATPTGEPLEGPLVTMQMAQKEGWSTKSGSKWLTMPELMLMYRSAAFWTRVYCPEMSLGLGTTEEIEDVRGISIEQMEVAPPQLGSLGNPAELEANLLADAAPQAEPTKVHDAVIEEPVADKKARRAKAETPPDEPPPGALESDREPESEG